jgi:hypothetical protein
MQKFYTGSANTKQCKSCDKGVYISWRYSIWWVVIMLSLLFASRIMKLETIHTLVIGLSVMAIYSILKIYFIPLSKDRIDEKL